MSRRRQLQIVGDGATGNWLAWQWDDGRVWVEEIDPGWALARLAEALPAVRGRVLDLGFEGALADPRLERDLSTALAKALLPPELRAQILAAAQDGLFDVRVAPSRQAASVPWGLLPIDGDRRLLDVADVSWIGPTLPRDVGAADAPVPPGWEGAQALPALHVLDPVAPGHGPVLSTDGARLWKELPSGHRDDRCELQAATSPGALSSMLLGRAWSRLFLLGHVTGHNDDASLVLSGHLAATRLLTGGLDALGEPDAAGILSGHRTWPMPPRVAVVACGSGLDMSQPEPFGLATAILANGADTVHATLWTLPTDNAFEQCGGPPALTELGLAIDRAQSAVDPVGTINQWQRDMLTVWGLTPSETAPRWCGRRWRRSPPRIARSPPRRNRTAPATSVRHE